MFHDAAEIYIYIVAKIQHNFKTFFRQQYLKKPQDGGVIYENKFFSLEYLLQSMIFLSLIEDHWR